MCAPLIQRANVSAAAAATDTIRKASSTRPSPNSVVRRWQCARLRPTTSVSHFTAHNVERTTKIRLGLARFIAYGNLSVGSRSFCACAGVGWLCKRAHRVGRQRAPRTGETRRNTVAVALYAVRSSIVEFRSRTYAIRLAANGQVIVAIRSTGVAPGPQCSIAWRVAPSGGASECSVMYVTTVGVCRPGQIDSRERHK